MTWSAIYARLSWSWGCVVCGHPEEEQHVEGQPGRLRIRCWACWRVSPGITVHARNQKDPMPRDRHQTTRLLTTALMLCLASPLSAGPLIDFSLGQPVGTHGSLNSAEHVQDGVTVIAGMGSLYRWNIADFCCDHVDMGLGILSAGEGISAAEPELDGHEFMRLQRPAGTTWGEVWFSSVNDQSALRVYPSIYPAGPSYSVRAGEGPFATAKEGFIDITFGADSWFLWILVDPRYPTSNFTLLHGVTLRQARDIPPEVPEPATLALLSGGLLLGAWRARRRR